MRKQLLVAVALALTACSGRTAGNPGSRFEVYCEDAGEGLGGPGAICAIYDRQAGKLYQWTQRGAVSAATKE